MSMLERLSDARGTLEGKIVAVILAVLLVLPVASVTAFAGGHDHESDATGNTEEVQTVSEELPDTGSVVLDETPAPEEEVPEVADPEPGTPTPEDPTEPEAPGVPAAPEPEDPPAATPTEEPTETEEPEATTVEVQLKIDEGATLKLEDDTFYTEDDTKMELTSDQEKEFTIEVDEGYELAVEKPVVFKDAEDTEEELEAVDGKYTFPTNVMDGGMLYISTEILPADEVENADEGIMLTADDDWTWPEQAQSIIFELWCTSRDLGKSDAFSTATPKLAALGSRAGMAPEDFAAPEVEKDGTKYIFHHAQVQPWSDKQEDQSGGTKYDDTRRLTSIRYNQSAGCWEGANAAGTWTSLANQQLIFYYHQVTSIGNQGNTQFIGKDFGWTETEWLNGAGLPTATSTACAIYQVYDENGAKIGDQIRTYYWSGTSDKKNNAISVAPYWDVEAIKITPLSKFGKGDVNTNPRTAFTRYVSPESFVDVAGTKVPDPNSFTIPWGSGWSGDRSVCFIAVKVAAQPSEQSLTVNYLDKDGQPIQGSKSVVAKQQSGQPNPNWETYIDIQKDVAHAKSSYALSDKPSTSGVNIPTNINATSSSELYFTVDKPGFAADHYNATITGETRNVLNLYFHRIYNVSYTFEGLDRPAGLDMFVGQDDNKLAGAPTVKDPIVAGNPYKLNTTHKAGDLARAIDKDGHVLAVYKFSGWKLNGADAPTNMTINSDTHFIGTWSKLTYSATIEAGGKTYDGDPIAKEHVTKVEKPDGYGDPTYQYWVSEKNEWTTTPPTDAGTYKVKAVWPATDKLPALESQPVEFAINKLAVTLQSASATKTFDGSDLTAHKMVRGTDEFETEELIGADWGFAKDQGVKITYTGICTQINSSVRNTYTYESLNGANLEKNYQITPSYGALLIQPRNANSLYKIDLTAASSRLNTYKGEAYTVSGLAMLDVVDPTTGTLINGDPDNSSFQLGGNTYTVSGYTAEVSAEVPAVNVGLYPVTITGTFVVKNQRGEVVTDQFAFNKFDGTLEITQRSVALASESATKVYDGFALTAPIEGTVDEVLAAEANVETTGSVTNVADSPRMNTIAVTPKTELAEGINEYNENNYVFTKDEGTLTITPQSINPGDSTERDPDPENPDEPFTPSDPNNPYRGIKVGNLTNEQYNGTKWEKTPEVTPAANSVNETITFDVARTNDLTNVGTKTVTITGKGNYTGTVTRTFDVTPAPVVIVVNSASKVYGQDDPTFTGIAGVPRKGDDGNWKRTEEGAYEVDSLFKNDRNNNKEDSAGNFTYVRSNADVQNVGTYKNVLTTSFDAANADAVKTAINANYSLVEVIPGNFSITQATATLNATGVTTTYDANEYAISVAPMGEEGWTVEYATTPNGPWGENPVYTEAGQYPVYVKATNPNYVDVYGTATVTINPAPVTIRVNDATKVAGSENPEFTGAIEGEVAGHELTGVSYYRKSDAEGIGTYENDLTASFDDNPNYTITVEDGDFTITAMPVPAEPVTPPTTPAPGPLDGIVTTVTDFLATPIIGAPAVADTTAIDDAENPLAQIEDDGTPMSAFDAPICWIHYYILLGIIITAIYGGGVIARRLGYSHKVKSYEDDVTGKEKKRDKVKDPAPNPAQPTI